MNSNKDEIQRYGLRERIVHWAVAISFVYLVLTGLALYSPRLYWLALVLGGGTTIRAWHPWAGVILFVVFSTMFASWLKEMLMTEDDRLWLMKVRQYITNLDEELPEAGRFNAGQKLLFWAQTVCILMLLLSGIPLWFPASFPWRLRLVSIIVHEISALAAIGALMVHIYMGVFVVRGSFDAMTRGMVTRAWARKHHGAWYRKVAQEAERM